MTPHEIETSNPYEGVPIFGLAQLFPTLHIEKNPSLYLVNLLSFCHQIALWLFTKFIYVLILNKHKTQLFF